MQKGKWKDSSEGRITNKYGMIPTIPLSERQNVINSVVILNDFTVILNEVKNLKHGGVMVSTGVVEAVAASGGPRGT